MKNKGFTLIELLGGIVILSIIALITIPIISNVINKTRLQSLKNSAYGLLDATALYYAQYEPTKSIRFDIENNTIKSSDTKQLLSYKGTIKNGALILNKNGKTTICITDGKNSAYKNYNESEIKLVEKETCYIPDNKSIVYLENSGATRDDLSTQELTDIVAELQSKIDELESKNQELENKTATKSELEIVSTVANSATLDKIYPKGSIYISTEDDTVEKVQNRFGGTWVEYGAGRTLVGVDASDSDFNTVEKTSGEKTHTLTVKEMPSHNHKGLSWSGTQISFYYNTSNTGYSLSATGGSKILEKWITTGDTGDSQPHNNLQPYITVYMYKRTA